MLKTKLWILYISLFPISLFVIPFFGIANPLTQGIMVIFVWIYYDLLKQAGQSEKEIESLFGLSFPIPTRGLKLIVSLSIVLGIGRYLLDYLLPGGWGGVPFYKLFMENYGILSCGNKFIQSIVVIIFYIPLLSIVAIIDGVYYCGLIQNLLNKKLNIHLSVIIQAFLFSLPHMYAPFPPDKYYGLVAFIGGIIYGYVFKFLGTNYIPSAFLVIHVALIWEFIIWFSV